MISQQRFDELVVMANKGGLHVREAINLAAHESVEIERVKIFSLVAGQQLKRFEKLRSLTIGHDENWRD